jgi:hypothetical protein
MPRAAAGRLSRLRTARRKQKYGALEFQAFPRQRAPGQKAWTAQENADPHKMTSDIRKRSERICEWC